MTAHFSAFSFVDRISEVVPDIRVRGHFTVPDGLAAFSPCLVAEAVGQLAAWAAMARTQFRRRPVAALAEEVRITTAVSPGQQLDLGVEIDQRDDDTIVYDGWADHHGMRVLELRRCVGPLLPLEDFDAPEAVRAHYITLCGRGAASGRFRGVAAHDLAVTEHTPGVGARASLHVPQAAAFFDDHFPRRSVFPATLLVDAAIELAIDVLERGAPQRARPTRIEGVKLRSFIAPGQRVEIEAAVVGQGADTRTVAFVARVGSTRVATARFTLGVVAHQG